VNPNVGATYSGSQAKQEEHRGFSHDDTNIVPVLSGPRSAPKTLSVCCAGRAHDPASLGIDPRALGAVIASG
jgi:hypothetical protein